MRNVLKTVLVLVGIFFLTGFDKPLNMSNEVLNWNKNLVLLASSDNTCNTNYSEGTCAYYLGHADEENSDCPVYWLNYAYQIIKYGIIVAVIVLDMLELTSAITKSGLESKVLKKCILRLVIAIAIILLPTLIDVFGQAIGVDGILCGIK